MSRIFEITEQVLTYMPKADVDLINRAYVFAAHAHARQRRSSGELFGSTVSQRLTIQCPASFAALWLAPRISKLATDLPNVFLDIKTVHLPADYDQNAANLQIHFGSGQFPGRKSLRLTKENLVPVVSTAILRKRSKESLWDRLPLLSVIGGREMWPEWFEKAGMQMPARPTHRFDTFIVALAAAKAGSGILLGSRPLIDEYILNKSLSPISELQYASENGHFVTYEQGLQLDYAERSFLSWLETQSSTAN